MVSSSVFSAYSRKPASSAPTSSNCVSHNKKAPLLFCIADILLQIPFGFFPAQRKSLHQFLQYLLSRLFLFQIVQYESF